MPHSHTQSIGNNLKAYRRSRSKLVVIVSGLLPLYSSCSPTIARNITLSCPATIANHKLSEIDMFSGPPPEMASLIPV